jgi:hypothetical protein
MSKRAADKAMRWTAMALVAASVAGCAAGPSAPRVGIEPSTTVAVAPPADDAMGPTSADVTELGAREALGFVLGTTTASDVMAWAAAHGTSCEVLAQGRRAHCRAVAADTIDGVQLAIDELDMRFDVHGRLHALKVTRRGLRAENARARFGQLAASWDQTVDAEPAAEPYARAERKRASHGLRASVTATNFADRGFQLIERYQLG